MTAEEYWRKSQDPLWYGEQDENGVDLSIIRENPRLTPTQRVGRAAKAAEGLLRLKSWAPGYGSR